MLKVVAGMHFCGDVGVRIGLNEALMRLQMVALFSGVSASVRREESADAVAKRTGRTESREREDDEWEVECSAGGEKECERVGVAADDRCADAGRTEPTDRLTALRLFCI